MSDTKDAGHHLNTLIVGLLLMMVLAIGYLFTQQHSARPAVSPAKAEHNTASVGGSVSGVQKEEVEAIVRDFIMNNPSVMLDSISNMQRKQREEAMQIKQQSLTERKVDLEMDSESPYLGNPEGSVILVEFFDYSCGYCKRAFPVINQLVEENPNLKVVMKEFPILGPDSRRASEISLAMFQAGPEYYEQFHRKLMEHRGPLSEDVLKAFISELKMDPKSFMEGAQGSKDVQNQIQKTYELARAIGVSGTPAFVIGGELIPGAVDKATLQAKINELQPQETDSAGKNQAPESGGEDEKPSPAAE